MKLINKFIVSNLKEDSDLIDSAYIDSSITYQEQKTEIEGKINLLLGSEQKHNNQIRTTKRDLQEQIYNSDQEGQKQILKQIWKSNRRILRRKYT